MNEPDAWVCSTLSVTVSVLELHFTFKKVIRSQEYGKVFAFRASTAARVAVEVPSIRTPGGEAYSREQDCETLRPLRVPKVVFGSRVIPYDIRVRSPKVGH